jgi:hypothetical protein
MARAMTRERATRRVREAADKLPPLKGGRFLPGRRKAATATPTVAEKLARHRPA